MVLVNVNTLAMKRIRNLLLTLFLFSSFNLVFPKTALADCTSAPVRLFCDSAHPVKCGAHLCCQLSTDDSSCPIGSSVDQPLDLETIQTKAFPSAPSLADTTPASIIGKILPYVFSAAGIALLIYLVLGGLQIMTSRGDPKAMQSAQAKITNAVIGFVIVIFAFFIVQIFSQVFGLGSTSFGLIFK